MAPVHDEALNAAVFRDIMSTIPAPVTVVTAIDANGRPHGLTAIAFCSVSLEPPLCSICIDKNSRTLPIIRAANRFVVNLLDASQEQIARQFASKADDKFAGIDWSPGPATGQPVLSGAVAYTECTIWEMVDAGDHWILIGHVEGGDTRPGAQPLMYWRRTFQAWDGTTP